jgi:osmoprotectant transport system substrate-binding protein
MPTMTTKLLKFLVLGLVFLPLFFLAACNKENQPGATDEKLPAKTVSVTIGGKDFTEQNILLKLASIFLRENGYEVKEVGNMRSRVLRSAIETGKIDLCWEYTGTALMVFHGQPAERDSRLAYEKIKRMDRKKGLIWLDKSGVSSPYVILMRKDRAEAFGIHTISELAAVVRRDQQKITFATNPEFFERKDGLHALQERYGFEFSPKNVVKLDLGLIYSLLKDDQVDVGVGIGTDGRILASDLLVLEDDRHFFPSYDAVPVVRRELLKKAPEVADLMNRISGKLDASTMRYLNYLVDVRHEDVVEVARKWLMSEKLIE